MYGDGQGGRACCSPGGRKEWDMTEQLNWMRSFRLRALNTIYWIAIRVFQTQGLNLDLLHCREILFFLQADSSPSEPPEKPSYIVTIPTSISWTRASPACNSHIQLPSLNLHLELTGISLGFLDGTCGRESACNADCKLDTTEWLSIHTQT